MTLYRQGAFGAGLSTVVERNRKGVQEGEEIQIITLKDICREHVPQDQDIHFLKIDVEGIEKEVLLGGDFSVYRPWIICIESTLPGTDFSCYEKWEDIIIKQDYIYVTQIGVNRYYVSKEHSEIKDRFVSKEELLITYRIFHAELM